MTTRSKILGVDDNPTNIEILEELLAEEYNFRAAKTGEEALKTAVEFRPDLILLDIMLPGINGYDVCRQLRANPALKYVKIIMVSAKAMTSERLRGYQAGADDYLVKPFDEEELTAKVKVYLGLKPAEELNDLKSGVLSLLNHETRTPLHGILGPAELLMSKEPMADEERISLADMIHESAELLNTFFEKVMLLGSLKSGKYSLCLEPGDFCPAVHEVIDDLQPEANDLGVTLEATLPQEARATLDREMMKRVLLTLLENAVRFSPPGGRVQLTVKVENEEICLSVRDYGPGMDAAFLPHVFDELTDIDIAHHTTGHGLSLAIARRIVLKHNGSITVESECGKGTQFTVRFPAALEQECRETETVVAN
jgi:two-component system, sensor histidine kinase and response regulator